MTKTIRTTKRACELERYEWFRPDFDDFVSAARVNHVEPYPSDSWGNGVVLLYRPVGEQNVSTHRLAADDQIAMLTEQEIEEAMDLDRRERIAAQLADVIRLVRDPAFPLPAVWQAISVEFMYADQAAVARCAAVLGVKVEDLGPHVAARRDGADDWSAGVDVRGVAYRKPDTEVLEHPEDSQPGGWHHGQLDPTGLLHSREADDPTPVSPARVPLHIGGPVGTVSDSHLVVDETPVEPVTRYFSFGHGQSDPATGKNLLNHYVTVVATTAEGCREAMLASRFGREWSMEYVPGNPRSDEWIAQWTEYERIDATSLRPGEHGRITNPDLAQFLAGKEDKRRTAAHFLGLEESAKHHPAVETPAHYETGGSAGPDSGDAGVDCACGIGFHGFDSLAEARELLDRHIADANAPTS